MSTLVTQFVGQFSPFQAAIWGWYLLAAVMLPANHVRPILKYLRGSSGIGDACIRTETVQCLWRVPALMFSLFVAPSLPLFLSIFLDMLGRMGRVFAMHRSHRRWLATQSLAQRPESSSSEAVVHQSNAQRCASSLSLEAPLGERGGTGSACWRRR